MRTRPSLVQRRTPPARRPARAGRPVAKRPSLVAPTSLPPFPPAAAFPIVGVGASAGGLEAFTQLLSALPPNSGMAFVLIQHLDPQHDSLLTQALSRATQMTVLQIRDGMKVERNHVYVIPPNGDVGILHGVLTLLPRSTDPRKLHLPVDFFFRALAADLGRQAIGVVLSGTASDGTAGLKAIKAEDGITLVQEPSSAKFAGMPQSALDAGVADAALAPAQLAEELARLGRHPYLAGHVQTPAVRKNDDVLKKIFLVVRNAVGVDYSEYKPATLERRLARRMALRRVATHEAYLELLLAEPEEARLLYEDVLIHVTSFFRDPEVFEQIKLDVFPGIVAGKADGAPIRLWVAGCATGEEVYSLAIALLEFLDDAARSRTIQIFGTDISEKAIEVARSGVYPDSALRDLGDDRRRRFFTKLDRGYRISKSVRELCVFVRHDLARDPPFSKLDLVSCRNVLIYFGSALQKRIIATFHYCLNQPGFLLLGRTESISGFSQFFTKTDRNRKTFTRSAQRSALSFRARPEQPATVDKQRPGLRRAELPRAAVDLTKYVDRILLSKYAPAGVLVNAKAEILQFRGRTGDYLEPAAGAPQTNLFKMAREGLLAPLRLALAEAQKTKSVIRRQDVLVGGGGPTRSCNLTIAPLAATPEVEEPLFLVLFEPSGDKPARAVKTKAKAVREGKKERPAGRALSELQHELASTKEYLESVVEEHARTNDDLASANEEFVSTNEELQSMNEELETAKEELQSTNEELTTVNDELHSRNQEVSRSNGDLVNLINTVDIPLVMLDAERRIKRFTPRARGVFNLQPNDVGRPIDEIKPNLGVADLEEQVAEVIRSGERRESEVRDRQGHWYRLQILPSLDHDSQADGAILSLIDIDALKHHLSDAEWARDYANGIVEAVAVPLVVLDERLCILSANDAFYTTFATTPEAIHKRRLFELDDGDWAIPELRRSLEEMLATQTRLDDLELTREFPRIGRRTLRISAGAVHARTNLPMILLTLEDISARKQIEDERAGLLGRTHKAMELAERANLAKDEFLAMLSHELRTPLATLLMQAGLLRRGAFDTAKVQRIGDVIERNTRLQVRLIDDLLDVSRIVAGKLTITRQAVDLGVIVRSALENVAALALAKVVPITVAVEPTGADPVIVSADPGRMVQAVTNLLTNAIKFSEHRGPVAVALTVADGQATVRVSDHGRGIDLAFLPHIFDRFKQQDSSTTRNFGGLGLGLAIVRHIVERHDGTVRAESAGSGHGATFWLTLPLLAAGRLASGMAVPPARLLPASATSELTQQLDGLRVLVVDDNAAVRETTIEILGLLGASAVAAASATHALAELDSYAFDVILCDLAMPHEDGYGFIRELRGRAPSRGGTTPAIAYTALVSDQDRLHALAAGFQLHLPKPIDADGLAASVVAAVRRPVAVS
jgi:two-component system, chemotaxis family, CheB/CheR fusion protein